MWTGVCLQPGRHVCTSQEGSPSALARELEGRLTLGWQASEGLLLQLKKAPCSWPASLAGRESWQWALSLGYDGGGCQEGATRTLVQAGWRRRRGSPLRVTKLAPGRSTQWRWELRMRRGLHCPTLCKNSSKTLTCPVHKTAHESQNPPEWGHVPRAPSSQAPSSTDCAHREHRSRGTSGWGCP